MTLKILKRFDREFVDYCIQYLLGAADELDRWTQLVNPGTDPAPAIAKLNQIACIPQLESQIENLQGWIANHLTVDGWNRLLTARRQQKCFRGGDIAILKVKHKTHDRFSQFCIDNKMTQDAAINWLLDRLDY